MDKQLAILQTQFLDTLAPLTLVLEAQAKGESLKGKDYVPSCHNSSRTRMRMSTLHISAEWVVNDLNKSLLPVIENDENSKIHPLCCLVQSSPKEEKKWLTKWGLCNLLVLIDRTPEVASTNHLFFWNGPMHVQSGGIQIKRIWERRSLKFLSNQNPCQRQVPGGNKRQN